jgi:hypothetical protein
MNGVANVAQRYAEKLYLWAMIVFGIVVIQQYTGR